MIRSRFLLTFSKETTCEQQTEGAEWLEGTAQELQEQQEYSMLAAIMKSTKAHKEWWETFHLLSFPSFCSIQLYEKAVFLFLCSCAQKKHVFKLHPCSHLLDVISLQFCTPVGSFIYMQGNYAKVPFSRQFCLMKSTSLTNLKLPWAHTVLL